MSFYKGDVCYEKNNQPQALFAFAKFKVEYEHLCIQASVQMYSAEGFFYVRGLCLSVLRYCFAVDFVLKLSSQV